MNDRKIIGINSIIAVVVMIGSGLICLTACGSKADGDIVDSVSENNADAKDNAGADDEIEIYNESADTQHTYDEDDAQQMNSVNDTQLANDADEMLQQVSESDEPEILHFVDAFGEPYETEINPDIEKNTYDKSLFIHDGYSLTYDDPDYECRLGVDVSHHNGQINWQKVADAGYEFAILRIGYRGYGQSGTLNLDKEFDRSIVAAQEAGLDVGVYFFAQAINEDEAVEEAEYVLDHLKGYELQLPVVYDPESILDDVARTDNVTGEQFTKNTVAFCKTVEAAGYDAMVYSNMKWEAYELDLTQLTDWPIWYADYEAQPQTPYRFTFWQYSNTGRVPGIDGDADLDIQLTKK